MKRRRYGIFTLSKVGRNIVKASYDKNEKLVAREIPQMI
jgi:hypothetical protein